MSTKRYELEDWAADNGSITFGGEEHRIEWFDAPPNGLAHTVRIDDGRYFRIRGGDILEQIDLDAAIGHYDVVEIDADNAAALGYDEDTAGLKVQYDGAWRYDAETLDDAAAYIAGAVGVPIELVAATNYASGRRWTVRRSQ